MSSKAPFTSAGGSDELGDGPPSSEVDSLLRGAAYIPEVGGGGADAEGRRLGHYVLGRRVGRGGMGEVYEATDRRLGRKVAIKVLPPEFAANGERRRRFLREARAAAAVSHPNLTAIYDVGEDEGTAYLAMELLAGRTLREALRAGGPLGVAEGVRVVRGVARGLEKAHAAGVVHRDLKPENVMLCGEGLVKVLDFGLAKVIGLGERDPARDRPRGDARAGGESTTEMVTAEGLVLGTPDYMSPEQAIGTPVDRRTDIFSLGSMFYEMLSGRRPFAATTAVEVLVRIARDEPPPISQVLPGVPADLERLLARCLAKRPADRFASCAELLAALDALEGATPAPLTRPPELAPAPRRRPSPWSRAGGAIALAASVGALAFVALRRDRAPAPGEGPHRRAAALSPAAAPDVLACPPLSVAPASAGPWLGAAVAQMVCDRVTILLGGRFERTVPPAALLDLPRLPMSSFPADPFAAPDARDRALGAARARASRWLGGEVEASESGYRVRLVLEGASGVVAEGEGRDAEVVPAARAAADALARGGGLGAQIAVDPSVADWLGAPRVSELLAFHTLQEDEDRGLLQPGGVCLDVERLAAEAGPLGPLVRVECALVHEGARPEPLPVDASTPGRLARTARYHRVSGGADDPRSLAADLRRALAEATDPLGRAVLAAAEAEMWLAAGEPEKARERALVAVQSEPRSRLGWIALMNASYGEPGFGAVVRAHAAWQPNVPRGWRWLAERPDADDPAPDAAARLLKFARRAHQMAPHRAHLTYALGEQLLRTGEREEVRALAAPLLSGTPEERIGGELLMVLVDASMARFSAAYERGRRALEADAALGGDGLRHELFKKTMALAALLDRRADLADALVRRFVDPEPRFRRPGTTAAIGATLCAAARRPLSTRCFERLARLVDEKYFLVLLPSTAAAIEGARHFAAGSHAKAAATWRPIASESGPAADLLRESMAEAFDRVGDAALAEIVDRRAMEGAEAFHGATSAHVRAARRAARRGDLAAARALAAAVESARATADVPPPALREMQALAGGP
jgi:serine/threonine protein kinase